MSIAIRSAVARSRGMGDPGLFDVIGKVFKTAAGAVTGLATGGPLGAIAGGLKGAGIIKTPVPPAPVATPGGVAVAGGAMPVLYGKPPQLMPGVGPFQPGTGVQITTPIGGIGVGSFGPAAPQGVLPMFGQPQKKTRRINPLNPRAASRAMRRLSSLKKATDALNKRLTKIAPKASRRSSYGGKAKKCGCR